MQLETQDRKENTIRETYQDPRTHRHGRPELEHAQHIQETHWPAEVGDEEKGTKCSSHKAGPQTETDQRRSAVEQLRDEAHASRHPGDTAKKEIERHFPSPHWRL